MLFLLFLQAMAAVLSTNAAIQLLNLEFCKIGDAGVEACMQRLDLCSPGLVGI